VNRSNEATAGRLEIQLQAAGALVPSAEEAQSADKGALDVAFSPTGYMEELADVFPLLAYMSGGLSPVQYIFWLPWEGDALMEEMYSKYVPGVKYICVPQIDPPEVWGHTRVPIETVEDLKKLKMRAAGEGGEILYRMGVPTVHFPSADIYESMQKGVIDAFESASAYINWGRAAHEIADWMYVSATRAPSDQQAMSINREKWEAISPDLQKTIHDVFVAEQLLWYSENVAFEAEYFVKAIEDAYIAEAQKYYSEKAGANPEFARVLDSYNRWRAICEDQRIQ
jgi:TRAP-type mannitol/chloroaromatic compound transport system substrate-binding protein